MSNYAQNQDESVQRRGTIAEEAGAPASRTPVGNVPASDTPASTAPASTAPAGTSPAGTAPASTAPIQNTNRWSTKQLVTMALMCAIAILLSFLEFPIFPAASFLKLDISFVPSAVMGFAFGTGPGILVGIACAVAHGAITGNWVGCLMNIIACCAFVIPSAAIYKRIRTFKGAMIGLIVAIVCLVIAAIVANLIVDPIFYGIPLEVVQGLIVPAILPFNIIKGVVISVLTAVVYKSISNLITPAKDQVKGR